MQPGYSDVGLVFTEKPYNSRSLLAWLSQYFSRLRILKAVQPMRLDATGEGLQELGVSFWEVLHRSVRFQTQSVTRFLQFPSGPRSLSGRCSGTEMESSVPPICLPPIYTDRANPQQGCTGESEISRADSSGMACTIMVSSTAPPVGGQPSCVASNTHTAIGSIGESSSPCSNRQIGSRRLEDIRSSQRYNGISDEAFGIISASWRRGTEKAYSSNWHKWIISWCGSRQRNPLLPVVEDVANFLTDVFKEGLQYSTVNSYRSALSATLPPIEGFPAGQHPLIVRLLQGMYNSRPPMPGRYSRIWRVETVLDYVRSHLPDNHAGVIHNVFIREASYASSIGVCRPGLRLVVTQCQVHVYAVVRGRSDLPVGRVVQDQTVWPTPFIGYIQVLSGPSPMPNLRPSGICTQDSSMERWRREKPIVPECKETSQAGNACNSGKMDQACVEMCRH